jgi:hypothetical protein
MGVNGVTIGGNDRGGQSDSAVLLGPAETQVVE